MKEVGSEREEREKERREKRFGTAPFCRLMSTMRGSASSRKKFLFFSYSSSSIIFTCITLLQEGRRGRKGRESRGAEEDREGEEKKRKVNL